MVSTVRSHQFSDLLRRVLKPVALCARGRFIVEQIADTSRAATSYSVTSDDSDESLLRPPWSRVLLARIKNGRLIGCMGQNLAFISGDSVSAWNGRHIAWYVHGHIRDRHGYVSLFTTDATNMGIVKPVKQVKPVQPIRQLPPMGVLPEQEAGSARAEVCRRHGISEQSLYRSKARYGGMLGFSGDWRGPC
jgi:hypothetical protein